MCHELALDTSECSFSMERDWWDLFRDKLLMRDVQHELSCCKVRGRSVTPAGRKVSLFVFLFMKDPQRCQIILIQDSLMMALLN